MAEDLNAAIGTAVRRHRYRAGLSQAELARRMGDHGHGWHPTTVARTESADRPLRFDEAVALANVLGLPVAALLQPPADDPEDQAAFEALTSELNDRELELGMALEARAAAEIRSRALRESAVVEQNRLAAAEEAFRMVQHAMDEATKNHVEADVRVHAIRADVDRLRAELDRRRVRFEAVIPVAPLPPLDALGDIERRRRGLPTGGE